MAAICSDTTEIGTLSWFIIAEETRDASLGQLLNLIEQGNPSLARSHPALESFWPICESVYVQDGALLCQDRVIIPASLRRQVLQHLRAAHQGNSSMERRVRVIVYWPGISEDISRTTETSGDCNRNAPSQAAAPLIPPLTPSTPFEAIVADFFSQGWSPVPCSR